MPDIIAHIDERGYQSALDYRETLLAQAKGASNDYITVTLYAMWIEHFVNGMIIRALERKGFSLQISRPLLRELRLQTKASALWEIAGLPAISDEHVALLEQIVQVRNSFVHYKWPAHDEEGHDQSEKQLKGAIEKSEALISALQVIESEALWNGRRTELIEYFRRT
jgi:hypothetical protein